jgi:2-isopropylmalate synthase
MDANNRVIIFDTTLRDGEQSPGATLNVEEKLAIAHQLALLGVDVIEAGFAVSSPGDFAAVKAIAQQVGVLNGPIICSLARAIRQDIQAAAEALQPAAHPRIHTFISTSDIHLKYQLKKSRSEVLATVSEMVAYAKSFVDDVEFSPMDASRTDRNFLYQVVEQAIAAGAQLQLTFPIPLAVVHPKKWGR